MRKVTTLLLMAACSLFSTAKASIADLENTAFQEVVGGNHIKIKYKTSFLYNAYKSFNGYRLFFDKDIVVDARYSQNEADLPYFEMSDMCSNRLLGQLAIVRILGRLPHSYEMFDADKNHIASICLIEEENNSHWQGTDPITGDIIFQITANTSSNWVLSYLNVDYFEKQQVEEAFLLCVMGILSSPINLFGLIQ